MRVLDIRDRILETTAEITRLERALAQRESRALTSSLKSLYRVRTDLEVEFKEAAAAGGPAQRTATFFAMFGMLPPGAVQQPAIVKKKPDDKVN